MNVSYQPGEWLAVVSEHAVVVVPGDSETDLTLALWSLMQEPVELATVIDVLSTHSDSSLTNLPEFAVLVRSESDVRLAVRGGAGIVVTAAEGRVTVSGAGVTTWSERLVPQVQLLTLSHAESDDAWLPLVCGVVRLGALEIDFERDPFTMVVVEDIAGDADSDEPGDEDVVAAESDADSDADADVDAEANAEADVDGDAEPEAEASTEPEPEPEPEPESEAEAGDEIATDASGAVGAPGESLETAVDVTTADPEDLAAPDDAESFGQDDAVSDEAAPAVPEDAVLDEAVDADADIAEPDDAELSGDAADAVESEAAAEVDGSTITDLPDEEDASDLPEVAEPSLDDAAADASVAHGDTLLPHHTRADAHEDASDDAGSTPDAPEDVDMMWADTVYRPPARPADPVGTPDAVPVAASVDDGIHDGATISLAQAQALRAGAGAAATDVLPQLLPRTGSVAAVAAPTVVASTVAASTGARVRLSTGQTLGLDRPVIIGRRPRSTRVNDATMPQLVAVESPQQDISRNHLEIRLEGDTVVITDLHTTNGTMLLRPGQDPVRLHPGETTIVVSGDSVDLGDGVTATFEELP